MNYLTKFSSYWMMSLGFIFLFSAWAKAMDFPAFVIQIHSYRIMTHKPSVIAMAVSVITYETILGIVLLVGWVLRGWIFIIVLMTLAGFSGLILYAWVYQGLRDCGCFGSYLSLSPPLAIFKNLVLIVITSLAWVGYRTDPDYSKIPTVKPHKVGTWKLSISVISLFLIFLSLANGIQKTHKELVQPVKVSTSIKPFSCFQLDIDGNKWNLGQGEYFVVFLSDSCPDCEAAVSYTNRLQEHSSNLPPIIALCLGEEKTLKQFREKTQPHFPMVTIPLLTFLEFIGQSPPRYSYIRDGIEVIHWDEKFPDDSKFLEVIHSHP